MTENPGSDFDEINRPATAMRQREKKRNYMATQYKIMSPAETQNALMLTLPPEQQVQYEKFGHMKAEPIFLDRILYIYKCTGKDKVGQQRAPEVLAMVRVINIQFTPGEGFLISLLNETANEKQVVTCTPAKLFGYDVYASVPTSVGLKLSLLAFDDGRSHFDASLVLAVKTANRSTFNSYRNIYMEAPSGMRTLYPNQNWAPDLN